jgi:glyoxylase-like metal-dependent hydrolase (beta-lactamase superfamily II)
MKRLLFVIAVALGASPLPPVTHAQQNQPGAGPLTVFQIQPNFHVISGAGGNVSVQIGPDGVVLVDAGSAAMADEVVATIRTLTDQPIRYILNTSPDADHIGGNETVAKAGVSLFARQQGPGGNGAAGAVSNAGFASIVGPETLLTRMSAPTGNQPPYPVVAWPTETFSRRFKDLFLNREGIQVIYEPAAHSDSDSLVVFRRSDVIATGDIFDITRFPVIDVDKGGSINGEIAALNHLLELTIPSIPMPWLTEGGTQVVPGHGRPCEEAEVVEYRDMVTIIRDRIQDMRARGMTLAQIKAANPTVGWRRRFGSDSGPWTTDMFVEAVYRSLTAKT